MRLGRRTTIATGVALVALAIAASPASAATTRAEYASQVNSICAASGSDLADSIDKIGKTRKPKALFRLMEQLTKDLRQIVDAVAVVSPAPGDEATVAAWIAAMRETVTEMDAVTDLSKKLLRIIKRSAKVKAILRVAKQLQGATRDMGKAAEEATNLGNQLGATECV